MKKNQISLRHIRLFILSLLTITSLQQLAFAQQIPAAPDLPSGNILILEDYEVDNFEIVTDPFGGGLIQHSFDENDNIVRRFIDQYTLNENGSPTFGLIEIKDFSPSVDASTYKSLHFSYYNPDANPTRTLQIQLRFDSNLIDGGTVTWNWKVPQPIDLENSTSDWEEVSIDLDVVNFEPSSESKFGLNFDLSQLVGIGVLILDNDADDASDSQSVYVDNIYLSSTTPIIPKVPDLPSSDSILILEDYEVSDSQVGEIVTDPFGGGLIQYSFDEDDNIVRRLIDQYTLNENGSPTFGLIEIKDFSPNIDVSTYKFLNFSYYNPDANPTRTLQVQLRFDSNLVDGETVTWNWEFPQPIDLGNSTSDWEEVSIGLDVVNFDISSDSDFGSNFDLRQLVGIGVLILDNDADDTSDSQSVYVDNIYLKVNNDDTSNSDTDNDGIDDDWERQFFSGSLDRDGTGDSDFDGSTDLEEYIAGSDPTDSNSFFRVDSSAYDFDNGSLSVTLTFTSNSDLGRQYRIEYNDDLTDPNNWTDSGLGFFDPDSGSTTTKAIIIDGTFDHLFFRVVSSL